MKLKVRPSMFSHTDNECMMSRFQNIYCQNHDPNVFYFGVSEKLRLSKKNMCSSWLMQNQRQAQNNYWKCYEVWTQLHHNLFYILLTQIPNYKIIGPGCHWKIYWNIEIMKLFAGNKALSGIRSPCFRTLQTTCASKACNESWV